MKPRFGAADVVTVLRFPLAALFPFAPRPLEQLVIVALAAATDLADGVLARRTGGSRWGSPRVPCCAVLSPCRRVPGARP